MRGAVQMYTLGGQVVSRGGVHHHIILHLEFQLEEPWWSGQMEVEMIGLSYGDIGCCCPLAGVHSRGPLSTWGEVEFREDVHDDESTLGGGGGRLYPKTWAWVKWGLSSTLSHLPACWGRGGI